MDLPKGKNGPKLPPKPRGGGAAARQRQFEQERGLADARIPRPSDADGKTPEPERAEECEEKE